MNVLKIASFIGVMLCGVAFGQPPGPPINPAQVGSNPLKSVVITDAGEVVSGSGGSGANPAFKLPGGVAGMWDDWGTGGLAFSYAAGTAATFYQGGTVGKLFLDTNGLQLPITSQFRFGVIGGAPDVGLGRDRAGVLSCTDGATGAGAINLPAKVSPPDTPKEGDLYTDSSHALCWYSGTAWVVVAGAGSCS